LPGMTTTRLETHGGRRKKKIRPNMMTLIKGNIRKRAKNRGEEIGNAEKAPY